MVRLAAWEFRKCLCRRRGCSGSRKGTRRSGESPRPNGNTAALVEAFAEGAKESGHEVTVVPICQKKIAGCLACEYCHTKGEGKCIQQDDMREIYPVLSEAEMIVLASPVYYHSFSGQLQCAINRIYALDKPAKLKKV